ncbi:MAG TPA: alpha/beta hydrolase [Anaerolineales bacterium]|nr:alpha/beta hydrolase [Anaerolineales bacterium]
MKSTSQCNGGGTMTASQNDFVLPAKTNSIQEGQGAPVVMIHGLAASLHDWDDLIPELVQHHYSAYALDLLGHGESAHPRSRAYQMDWMFDHMAAWIDSLNLNQPLVIIGHSLGGYLAIEYARRFPARTCGLILIDPFFRVTQLFPLLRLSYRQPAFEMAVIQWTPQWLLRIVIDLTSLSMGHSNGGAHNLPENIRTQAALDYKRTAPGVYNLPGHAADLTPYLPEIEQPTLVVWGTRDNTLKPASFEELIATLPHAEGKCVRTGHVPHQSNSAEFNAMALEFLQRL